MARPSGREVVAALRHGGFEISHIRGSHHYLRKPGAGGLVVVPVHGNQTLPAGTLRSIIRQCGLSDEEFASLL